MSNPASGHPDWYKQILAEHSAKSKDEQAEEVRKGKEYADEWWGSLSIWDKAKIMKDSMCHVTTKCYRY